MALTQRLQMRQSQALVMTPQLMQAIKLLQLSSLDLVAYVDAELERNPLLERANDDDGPPAATEAESNNQPAEGSEDSAANPDWMGADLETSRSSMEQGLGTELENVFPDDGGEKLAKPETPEPAYSEWSGAGAASGEDYNLEAFVASETTLSDHLAEQLSVEYSQRDLLGRPLVHSSRDHAARERLDARQRHRIVHRHVFAERGAELRGVPRDERRDSSNLDAG